MRTFARAFLIVLVLASCGDATSLSVEGTSLPPFPATGDDPAVGMLIPEVAGADFDGDTVTIGPDDGPLAIAFLAHWCPHCQTEVTEIQAWLDGGGQPAMPLVSVATGTDPERPNYPPESWLEREGWSVPVVVDDNSVMQAFGGTAFPFWVFVDAEGRVTARVAGQLEVEALAGS